MRRCDCRRPKNLSQASSGRHGKFLRYIANDTIAGNTIAGADAARTSDPQPQLRRYAPVHPVRGQMLALRSTTVRLKKVLRSDCGYLVPRRDGRIIAGSTLGKCRLRERGHAARSPPDPRRRTRARSSPGRRENCRRMVRPAPWHAHLLPIIGPTDIPGLWLATGHYRNGILLAPPPQKSCAINPQENRSSIRKVFRRYASPPQNPTHARRESQRFLIL